MMFKKTTLLKQIGTAGIAIAFLSLISGCATLDNNPNNVDISAYSNVTSVDAIKDLESNIKNSKKNELNVFAPDHFTEADKALIEARELIAKNQPRERVVQKVAVAEAVLKNGDLVMKKVKDILEDQLVVKEKLKSLKSDEIYKSEYGSLVERLNHIIREIENGNIKRNEEHRGKLLQDLQKLEQRSIRYNAMHEPEEILKRVKYRGGEKLAPRTYEDALAVFKRAEEFIAQNPNYETGIEQMGQEALFAAKRALYITEQVASLSQKVSLSLEQVILDEEYRLYRVARELGAKDIRNNPLEVQSEILANVAKTKAEEYRNKEGLILALRDTLINVRDSSAELTALSNTSKKLKEEKGEWLAKEALYKAKVSHLEENLAKSQSQLDKTQQILLSIKDENSLLFNQLNTEKEIATKLQNDIRQVKADLESKSATTTAETTQATETEAPTQNVAADAITAPTEVEIVSNDPTPNIPSESSPAQTEKKSETTTPPPVVAETINDSTNSESTDKNEIDKEVQITKTSPTSETETVAAAELQTSNEPKSSITEKETIDALNSVLKLINIKSADGESTVAAKTESDSEKEKPTSHEPDTKESHATTVDSNNESKVFVDAGE